MPDSISIPLFETDGHPRTWWKNAQHDFYRDGCNLYRWLQPYNAVLNTRWDTITFKSEADYLLFLLKYS